MLRHLTLVLLAAAVPTVACLGADALEGEWRIYGEGAVLRVNPPEREGGPMEIVWMDGPAVRLLPGTVIGTARPGAAPGLYDFSVQVDPTGRARSRHVTFAARLSQDGDDLIFETYDTRRRVSIWRIVPYFFRVGLTKGDRRPDGLDGARRTDAPPKFLVL